MSFVQHLEEVEFTNSYSPADKFAGFDRGDAGRDHFRDQGERTIGRMTNAVGQRVTIVETYDGDLSLFEVRIDGKRVTEMFDDRARAGTVARWWMNGCPT